MTRTTIDENADVATLINVFEVAPENQRQLVELLDRATEEVMRHRDGFVAANIHASQDGHFVVNYAQWASQAAFEAMLADPVCREHMDATKSLATATPRLYTVESTHHR